MFLAYRNFVRLFSIAGIVARQGVFPSERHFLLRAFNWVVRLRPSIRRHWKEYSQPERFRMALEELGPTFIKFGQAISTRMDALPDDYGVEMKKLQDSVPPFAFDIVQGRVEQWLGAPIEELFKNFDPEPVASASIAQVHKAETLDGDLVAVKVMRPNVAAIVEADIHVLTALANFVDAYVPELRRIRATQVVQEFAGSIRNEMNFQIEAARAQKFHTNFEDDDSLHIPKVYWPLTSQKVLTLEWVEGVPIDELSNDPSWSLDVVKVSRDLITAFIKQVFWDGYFHADQHPGNIFVRSDGTISILDFGIVGHIDQQSRVWLAKLLWGFLKRDYYSVALVHLEAGYIPPGTRVEEFEEACRQVAEPIFGKPLREVSIAKLLAELFKVTERFQIEVQPQLLLLQKTLFTLEGVGREINPELNIWTLAEPLIRNWVMDNMGPKGKVRSVKKGVKDLGMAVSYLPSVLHAGLERLAHNRLHVNINPQSLETLKFQVQRGFQRQTKAIVGGFMFLSASVMLVNDVDPWISGPTLAFAIYSLLRARIAGGRGE